nr:hypothetical protein [Winogradskyella sp.]
MLCVCYGFGQKPKLVAMSGTYEKAYKLGSIYYETSMLNILSPKGMINSELFSTKMVTSNQKGNIYIANNLSANGLITIKREI